LNRSYKYSGSQAANVPGLVCFYLINNFLPNKNKSFFLKHVPRKRGCETPVKDNYINNFQTLYQVVANIYG